MRTWLIYCATNTITKQTYVGQTHRSFAVRKREHLTKAPRGHLKRFHHALNAHGADKFVWTVMVEGLSSVEEADDYERRFIVALGSHVSCGGYNLTWGGRGSQGFKHSPKARKKIGDRFRGIPKTEEQRRKMGQAISKARKGKKYGPRNLSEEERKRLSILHTGRPHKGGWHHLEETKTKLRKPKSEETKKRMSEAQRLRYTKEKAHETVDR